MRVSGVKRGTCDVRTSVRSQARLQPALLTQLRMRRARQARATRHRRLTSSEEALHRGC